MNTKEILENLNKTCSTDYRSYLELNLKHIEKYGEKPSITFIGKSYDNYEAWGDGEEICGRTPLKADNVSIYLKNEKAYEISKNADLYLASCTANEYIAYKDFICWNSYIGII